MNLIEKFTLLIGKIVTKAKREKMIEELGFNNGENTNTSNEVCGFRSLSKNDSSNPNEVCVVTNTGEFPLACGTCPCSLEYYISVKGQNNVLTFLFV